MTGQMTIVELEFMGKPTGQFEIRREDANTKFGYTVEGWADSREQAEEFIAAARRWRKVAPSAWKSSDERVIVKTPRKRIGRNGWRVAGYELSATVNGPMIGFFTKLSEAKAWK